MKKGARNIWCSFQRRQKNVDRRTDSSKDDYAHTLTWRHNVRLDPPVIGRSVRRIVGNVRVGVFRVRGYVGECEEEASLDGGQDRGGVDGWRIGKINVNQLQRLMHVEVREGRRDEVRRTLRRGSIFSNVKVSHLLSILEHERRHWHEEAIGVHTGHDHRGGVVDDDNSGCACGNGLAGLSKVKERIGEKLDLFSAVREAVAPSKKESIIG